MSSIDWVIALVPMLVAVAIGIKARKYIKGVADFVSAGRSAGRYVFVVSGGAAAMGVVGLIAGFELLCRQGFAKNFWAGMVIPFSLVLTLTGYVIFRFRETRAMTVGQFFEIRYNRALRIVSGILHMLVGMTLYIAYPAIVGKFFVYFWGLPLDIEIFGMPISTSLLIMLTVYSISGGLAIAGGKVSVMVTKCLMGIILYLLCAIVVVFILVKYSWYDDIVPAMLNKPKGMSMINPYDISEFYDFSWVGFIILFLLGLFSRTAGNGCSTTLDAHEQKMSGILNIWRSGFCAILGFILAIAAFSVLNNPKFASTANKANSELTARVSQEVYGSESAASQVGNMEDSKTPAEYEQEMQYRALSSQMRFPVTLRYILPTGIMGIFCAICICGLIAIQASNLHMWGSIFVQDVILPIRGKPFTPRKHLRLIRILIVAIALFAIIGSGACIGFEFNMLLTIIVSPWITIGPCFVLGLYWKRATTSAAFTALIFGSALLISGVLCQRYWANVIYPWLVNNDLVDAVGSIMQAISDLFSPYIMWDMNPVVFPITGIEMNFIVMSLSLLLFVVVSLLTCKKPFNMNRMLHRGKYQREGAKLVIPRLGWKTLFPRLLGFDSQYTRGDKALVWSVVGYSLVWSFGGTIVVIIWNRFYAWPIEWWSNWYFFIIIVLPCIIGLCTSVWFSIGAARGLRKMLGRLKSKSPDVLDDGRVIRHISADEVEHVEELDDISMLN